MLISIWGFMGSGKSTLGKYLAEKDDWQHIDSDQEIERIAQSSINEIFREFGESYFRDLETNFLQQLCEGKKEEKGRRKLLLTTGGGMPLRAENRKILRELGPSIFLHVPFEEIARRLGEDKDRPLWDKAQLEAMNKKYVERLPIYQEADLCLNVGQKDIEQVAGEIMDFLHTAPRFGEK